MTATGTPVVSTSLALSGAWAAKAERLADEVLVPAEKAPALFRPEYVTEVEAEAWRAMRWADWWMDQARAGNL